MIALVTGATGLLRNNVVRRLLAREGTVLVLARTTADSRPPADLPQFEIHHGDVRDAASVMRAAESVHIGRRGMDEAQAINDGQPGQWHFRNHGRRHFRTAERLVSLWPRFLARNSGSRNAWLPSRSSVFLGSVRSLSEAGHLAASLMPRVRQDSAAVDVDHGKVFGRGLKDVAVVMGLHELAPVGRWATSGCDRWRLERSAKMGQDLPDRPWFRDEVLSKTYSSIQFLPVSVRPAIMVGETCDMAKAYPAVAELRELRSALGKMRLFEDLAIGPDGRNRTGIMPFRARTSRIQPSNAKFIFGPSRWLRSLIKPEAHMAVAYIDYGQQEFGIAAALSGDEAMATAYRSGDPYLAFGKQAGAIPPEGTKATHKNQRVLFKACVLAVQYGMGAESLATRIGQPVDMAKQLLRLHRETYPAFWKWSESAVDRAMLLGRLETVFGWPIHVGPSADPMRGANARSLANFPCQAHGAEMLRLACCMLVEAGIGLCCPVHDAVLIEGPADAIDVVVAQARRIMAEASMIVLGGFEIGTDAEIVKYPDRYIDDAGEDFWNTVTRLAGPVPTSA